MTWLTRASSHHILDGCQGSMFVEASHRIVGDHNRLPELRVLIERSEEKRESERISIASAKRIAESWSRVGSQSDRHVIDDNVIIARWSEANIDGAD